MTTSISINKRKDDLSVSFEKYNIGMIRISTQETEVYFFGCNFIEFKNKVLWAYEEWRRNEDAKKRLAAKYDSLESDLVEDDVPF